jgi:hypothetical protein
MAEKKIWGKTEGVWADDNKDTQRDKYQRFH